MINALLYGSAAVCLTLTAAWIIQLRTKNAGIVDGIWSYNFGLLAAIYFFTCEGFPDRKILLLLAACAWSLRLGSYLTIRNAGKQEESRYAELRNKWGAHANTKMLAFFYLQGALNLILSTPFLMVMMNEQPQLHLMEWMGFAVVLIALSAEGVADAQLWAFKKREANKGKVCTARLWNYSRHPNYFFEWLVWIGFFLMAVASPFGIWSISSPLIILWTLLKATGIPITETLAVKTKGDAYREYQHTTSAFIPWLKKKKP